MASLDASKAFDRINHEKLFVKLSERGAPQCFISVLLNWYNKLTFCQYLFRLCYIKHSLV